MRTVAPCRYCGIPVEVEQSLPGFDEFAAVLNRMALAAAACQPCGERHEAELAAARSKELADEAEHARKLLANAFTSVVGRKYRETSLGNFRTASPGQAAALAAAREFSANPAGFLYLHGKPGVGKTHLAVGIFREHALEVGRPASPSGERATFRGVAFWSIPELLLHLRSAIGGDTSEEEAIAPLVRARLLVLDDLGAEKVTDWVRQAFYVVISRRECDELPTVITSNLSLGELEARVGDERITSRIGGAARIVRVDGADGRIEGRRR